MSSRPRFTLRSITPSEAEVQTGILELAQRHRAVLLAVRANAGGGVFLRPPPGADGWKRLHEEVARVRAYGFFSWPNPTGWMRLAPEGTPDIVGVMATGHGLVLDAKKPGGARRPAQVIAVNAVQEAGGLGAFPESVDETDALFRAWERRHRSVAALRWR